MKDTAHHPINRQLGPVSGCFWNPIQGNGDVLDMEKIREKLDTFSRLDLLILEAYRHRHVGFMKKLLELGANPNVSNLFGMPLLMTAIYEQQEEVVRLLLDAGADINTSHAGFTPMMYAQMSQNPSIINLLNTHTTMNNNQTSHTPPAPTTIDELLNSQWGKAAEKQGTVDKILEMVPKILKKLSHGDGMMQNLANKVSELFELLRMHLKGENVLTPRNFLIIVAGLLYLISPWDFIPDFIPAIGWLDDMGILILVYEQLKPVLTKLFSKAAEESPAAQDSVHNSPSESN